MSKRRSVICSVVLEGRTQADTARLYGVSAATVSRWVARYRIEGEAAFGPRSRRPHTSPDRISGTAIELIVDLRRTLTADGLDAGPETIGWYLQRHHDVVVSASTIRRYLVAKGLVIANPKKRPKSSFIRFEASLPNEMWQTDMTHVCLHDGSDVEVLTWLDDHSRYALSVTAHRRVTGPAVVDTFTQTVEISGVPASVLSDNAMYYTTRYARGGDSGPNRFETLLAQLGVVFKHSRPNHPRTCGKVERFQQTLKKWLTAQPQPRDLDELQGLLKHFVEHYNHHRPHRALDRTTPAAAYTRLPKAQPTPDPTSQLRIRHDRVDKSGRVTLRYNGRLHHIGIGRTLTGTRLIMLIDDRDIRIINHTTGEPIRQLTLNPNRDYQPRTKT